MWGYPLLNTIVESGVEIRLAFYPLIGITHQALGKDQRVALVIVRTDYLLDGIAHHVDIDETWTTVLGEVDPIGVFHVGGRF